MKRTSLLSLVLSMVVMTLACTTSSVADSGNSVISSVSPSQVVAGGAAFTLSVYGSGFVGNAVVLWNGSARTTQFISKTQLQASISSTDLRQAGTAQVTVTDQRGNSLVSNSALVTIQAPAPLGVTTSSLPSGEIAGSYSAALNAKGGVPPYKWGIASGSLPPGLALSSSTGAVTGTPTGTGQYSVTVQVQDSQASPQTATGAVAISIVSPLQIKATSLPSGQIQASYQATVAATGGVTPYRWSVILGSLPPGLALSASTGAITGTPTASGQYSFTVQAQDSAASSQIAISTLSISVAAASAPQITTSALPNGTMQVAYNVTLAATGGTPPYSWSVVLGSLPPGLALGASTGAITGTPTTSGQYSFTLQAQDSAASPQTASKQFAIGVGTAALQITTTTLPNGTVQVAYSATLAATGGTPPYSWSIASGSLPTGLLLTSSGQISGIPTPAGSSSFTAQVQDSKNNKATQAMSISIATPPAGAAAPVVIIPSGSPAVNQGATINFTETAGDSGTWSCGGTDSSGNPTTCRGSINPSTGAYTAPAVVNAQQSVGGYQLLPNNHIFNTRVDSLPVNPNSAAWIAGAGTHQVIYTEIAKPLNYTNASTPTQSAVFYYTPANNGTFEIPAYPGVFPTEARIEGGWISAQTNQNSDHHLLTINTTSGNMQDLYQWYTTGLSGSCSTCNSQSGVKYTTSSYNLPNGATDAAGMYITPLLLRLQEVEQAIATGGTINHALRMTLNLGYCASSNIWPATTFATDGGTVPFGARFRLKSSFNISGYSPIARILLTQLKQYGLILSDGGTGWSVDVEYAKWPTAIQNAFLEISAANTISPSNFEAVDESGLMVSSASGETTNNRETVTYTRTSDGATASADIVLTGVAVNFPHDLLQIQVGAPAQQLTALVNIGGVTWSMSPSVGTLSSTGLYTPPSSVGAPTTITVTATSTVNSSVAASMTLNVFPAGPIRLVPGNAPGVYNYTMVPAPYTDSSRNVWSSIGDDGGYAYNGGCSIAGTSDPALYCYEYLAYAGGANDVRFDFIVPNGSYQINYKAASTFGTVGTQIQDLEVNGNIVYPNLDLYAVSGGSKIAWDWNTTVSVTNNRLSFVLRIVNNAGTRIGALQITP